MGQILIGEEQIKQDGTQTEKKAIRLYRKFIDFLEENNIFSLKPLAEKEYTSYDFMIWDKEKAFAKDEKYLNLIFRTQLIYYDINENTFLPFAYNLKMEQLIYLIPEETMQNLQGEIKTKFVDYVKKIYKDIIISKALEKKFYSIIQGNALNALTTTKTNNIPQNIDFLGNAEIKANDKFTLTIKEYNSKGISPATFQLLDCFLIYFTEASPKDTRIRLPLKQYMEWRGLTDTKTAREQVLSGIEALKRIEYRAKENIKGKWTDSGSISIYGGTGYIRQGVIYFNFNIDFYNTLLNYKTMEYSKDGLLINTKKNPHAYYLNRYISLNHRINEGKERLNIITIKTLLSKCPLIPNYEDVAGQTYKRIIEPLIRDLDCLPNLYYDFLDSDNNIIEDPNALFKGQYGYNNFITSKIKIDYEDYPTHKKRIDNRKKHQAKTQKKTEKKGG